MSHLCPNCGGRRLTLSLQGYITYRPVVNEYYGVDDDSVSEDYTEHDGTDSFMALTCDDCPVGLICAIGDTRLRRAELAIDGDPVSPFEEGDDQLQTLLLELAERLIART